MDYLLLEDMLMWDSLARAPMTVDEFIPLDSYLYDDYDATGDKLIKDDRRSNADERVDRLTDLGEVPHIQDNEEVFDLEDWMEEKFDLTECGSLPFNSFDDVELILNEDHLSLENCVPMSTISEGSSSQDLEPRQFGVDIQEGVMNETSVSVLIPASVVSSSIPIPEATQPGPSVSLESSFPLVPLPPTPPQSPLLNENNLSIKSRSGKIAPPTTKIRSRPYTCRSTKGQWTEIKKNRKKNQNRDAATRYRIKKKCEADALLVEETLLQKQNEELMKKVDGLANEIKYLKGLLKELLQVKSAVTGKK